MSGVGALAVLDILASHDWDGDAEPGNAAVDETRAAFATLIEATDRLATAAERRDYSTGCAITVMTARAELAAAAADARNALARVGGES